MDKKLAQTLIAIGASIMALATIAGAVGSHALAASMDAGAMRSFETAVQFQFFHGLGLMIVTLYAERRPRSPLLLWASAGLVIGVVLFCAGVYTSSLGGPEWIAALAPAGGIALIASWLVLAIAAALDAGASSPRRK